MLIDVAATNSAVLRVALAELVERPGHDGVVTLFAEDENRPRQGLGKGAQEAALEIDGRGDGHSKQCTSDRPLGVGRAGAGRRLRPGGMCRHRTLLRGG